MFSYSNISFVLPQKGTFLHPFKYPFLDIFFTFFVSYLYLSKYHFVSNMDKNRTITLRLTDDQLNLLDKMRKEKFLSKAEFIRIKLFKEVSSDR